MLKARYVHTNIVARDWKVLSGFYERVFGCTPVPPERDLSGTWIEEGTGVKGARICGTHLRMPGNGQDGPTLEIFQYNTVEPGPAPAINRPGLGHLAFAVDDVREALQEVLAEGGGVLGRVVSHEIPEAGTITFAYARDPEGNIIELQHWSRND